MRTTFNINFLCRKSKVSKSGKAPIEMSIIINGRRTYINLPRKENPEKFNRLVNSKKNNELKEFLEQTYERVLECQTELIKRGVPISVVTIKDFIQKGYSDYYTIEDLFADYLQILHKRVGVDLCKTVYRRYVFVRDLFFDHIDKRRQVNDITHSVIVDFYAELNSRYESTTAAGMISKLKTITFFAIDNGKLKVNPFNGVKIKKKTKDVLYLTESEIMAIQEKRLIGRLEKVRDLFLFQCFTGLSYSDMASLTKDDFHINENGQIYVKKPRRGRRRTNRAISVKLIYWLKLNVNNLKSAIWAKQRKITENIRKGMTSGWLGTSVGNCRFCFPEFPTNLRTLNRLNSIILSQFGMCK